MTNSDNPLHPHDDFHLGIDYDRRATLTPLRSTPVKLLPMVLFALLSLTACTSTHDERSTPGMSKGVADMRTIEIDGKEYQVRWIECKVDYQALADGERGLLHADQDPWAKLSIPSGTIVSIPGCVLVSQDGQMNSAGEIVSWENRDLQLGGGSANLSRRSTHAIPAWRLPSNYNYQPFNTLAGSRKVASSKCAPLEYFLDGERYVFCVKRDADGEITTWIGDVLAVIHLAR